MGVGVVVGVEGVGAIVGARGVIRPIGEVGRAGAVGALVGGADLASMMERANE